MRSYGALYMDDREEKLKDQIQKFLTLYHVLPSEVKAKLEIELGGRLKNESIETQKLYFALLDAAKDGKDIPETIGYLNQAHLSTPPGESAG